MHLVALGWIYVVLMMAVAEALGPNGTVLGAVITFVLYGVVPLSIVLYVMATPRRRRNRRAREAATEAAGSGLAPDGSDHAPGDTIATEREEA